MESTLLHDSDIISLHQSLFIQSLTNYITLLIPTLTSLTCLSPNSMDDDYSDSNAFYETLLATLCKPTNSTFTTVISDTGLSPTCLNLLSLLPNLTCFTESDSLGLPLSSLTRFLATCQSLRHLNIQTHLYTLDAFIKCLEKSRPKNLKSLSVNHFRDRPVNYQLLFSSLSSLGSLNSLSLDVSNV
jgi:hypothetical protein